jgi:hypothetical protein
MNLRVVKHEADEEKDSFKVTVKGEAGDLVDGCLIEVEIRLKGKNEGLLEKFPRGTTFQVSINQELHR